MNERDAKIQIVQAFDNEQNEQEEDDWVNYDPVNEDVKEDELLNELIFRSVQLQRNALETKKHYGIFEEKLNDDPKPQHQLRKTKIDYIFMGGILLFFILLWFIFLRK